MSRTFYHLRLLTFICPPHAAGLDDIRGKSRVASRSCESKTGFLLCIFVCEAVAGMVGFEPTDQGVKVLCLGRLATSQ